MRASPPRPSRRAVFLTVLPSLVLAACGDDGSAVPGGPGGSGGGTGATSVVTTGGPWTCDACPPQAPVCVDDTCANMCPAGLSVCDTSPGGALSCCEPGEQCCPGLGEAQLCAPAGEPCPVVCADGSLCPDGQLCQLDVVTGTFDCTDTCAGPAECGTVCCPFGSRCEDGSCPLPDLSIDEARLAATAEVVRQTFSESSCSLQEGCLGAAGERKLLKFDLGTPNKGAGDLFLGSPAESDPFEYSPCHDHFHFKGYAQYTLLDEDDQPIGVGEKQAFCLLDYEKWDPAAGPEQYHCGFQGISKGWSDIYESNLPCQWIDVTDVPPGAYTLVAQVNFEKLLAESDYTNNTVMIPFVIEQETCTGGCGPSDPACCGGMDTCLFSGNGLCDCGGFQPWDYVDCQTCSGCTEATTCPGGCTPSDDVCCDPANPCGLGPDGICQCAGAQAWDAQDCAACISSDLDCAPVDSCPSGCPSNAGNACCADPANDTCGWAGDGFCDCGGIAWDFLDCSSCACG